MRKFKRQGAQIRQDLAFITRNMLRKRKLT